jgi:hypothetical protein
MKARAATLLDIATGRTSPKKDPGDQLAGALARKSGQTFEAALAGVHAWYDNSGDAAVEKVNPPVSGWGESLHVGASTVDYTGTFKLGMTRFGLAFDAKMVTGAATFGVHCVGGGKHEARNRRRFFCQVQYLKGLADRHGYFTGFLLHCSDLNVTWWVGRGHLQTLLVGNAVPIRTLERANAKLNRPAGVRHHLPYLAGDLERAAIPQLKTRRPLLDYLRLVAPYPQEVE